MPSRAKQFRYSGLEVSATSLTGHYQLDDFTFSETVTFEVAGDLREPGPREIATLWYLIAGLSYFKAGAPELVDLGETPVTPQAIALLQAAIREGLAEFAYRNQLWLGDVAIFGGTAATTRHIEVDPLRALTPFGGGIDSVVTVRSLNRSLNQALFVMSPPSGTFAPLEATAAHMQLPIVRATRHLDPQITAKNPNFFNGHVPVTAMVTLLACIAALADDRGAVVMSNEHSASAPNLIWDGLSINHQWSKSAEAEHLIGDAVASYIGTDFTVASFLRDRSELWVAERFATFTDVHSVFRSCNRAFRQEASERAAAWCKECDKCLFINLVLAPFLSRAALDAVFGGTSPLTNPTLNNQLLSLVGLGEEKKPFECVGDPDECAVALNAVVAIDEYASFEHLHSIARACGADQSMEELLQPLGASRVPASWL
jgi:hypothetical protein